MFSVWKELFILSVVLYGCEIWFLIVRDEHLVRVFEKRVLRSMFGPERGSNRKL
jgi:hypothetical protein